MIGSAEDSSSLHFDGPTRHLASLEDEIMSDPAEPAEEALITLNNTIGQTELTGIQNPTDSASKPNSDLVIPSYEVLWDLVMPGSVSLQHFRKFFRKCSDCNSFIARWLIGPNHNWHAVSCSPAQTRSCSELEKNTTSHDHQALAISLVTQLYMSKGGVPTTSFFRLFRRCRWCNYLIQVNLYENHICQ